METKTKKQLKEEARHIKRAERLIKWLEKKKVDAGIKVESDGTINVSLGMFYPDAVANKAFSAIKRAKLDKVNVMGELSGGNIIWTGRAGKGKQNW